MAFGTITINVATGTADAVGYGHNGLLFGFEVRESAVTAAAAEVIIRDGADATGKKLANVVLAADGVEHRSFGTPVRIDSGVFIDRVAGETEVILYVG